MNDTTRDERLEKDSIRRNDDPEYRAWRYNNDLNHVEAIYEFVDRKVADAVAARDAEIREALLEAADGYIVAKGQDGEAEAAFATKPWMEQILDHIGLHGDGTGGQG